MSTSIDVVINGQPRTVNAGTTVATLIGELGLAGTDKMQKEGAEELVQSLAQLVELIVTPLPDAPVGVGAKWEVDESANEGGVAQKGKRVVELKELGADGVATIVATTEAKVPKRPVPDPRAPRGSTMEADIKGTYTYTIKFDAVASKVVGENVKTIRIEAPGGDQGQKQRQEQQVKAKHLLDTPK